MLLAPKVEHLKLREEVFVSRRSSGSTRPPTYWGKPVTAPPVPQNAGAYAAFKSETTDGIAAGGASAGTVGSTAGFFAVDVRVWRHVCKLGLNAAIAFLVLARGSGGDNARTSWSTDAVERYTGISRHKAKAAIQALEDTGVLELLKGGTKPSRRIRRASDIPWCEGHLGVLTDAEANFLQRLPITVEPIKSDLDYVFDKDPDKYDFTPDERAAYDADPQYNFTRDELRLADALAWKGFARWEVHYPIPDMTEIIRGNDEASCAARWHQQHPLPLDVLVPAVIQDEVRGKPQWSWLPNSLVDGANGETPPIELIRQTRQLETLRIFIELYRTQSLIRHGGIDPAIWNWDLRRRLLRRNGQWNVWRFDYTGGLTIGRNPILHVRPPSHQLDAADVTDVTDAEDHVRPLSLEAVFEAFEKLRELKLIEEVTYLFEGDDADAESMCPLPASHSGVATEAETALTRAANAAALRLAPNLDQTGLSGRVAHALPASSAESFSLLPESVTVPVLVHIEQVQAVGLARLRYRAHTTATAQWRSRDEEWEDLANRFDQIGI